MPPHDLFAEMLVRVPLNPLQSNWVSKNLLLNPFKLSLARVDQSRLGVPTRAAPQADLKRW